MVTRTLTVVAMFGFSGQAPAQDFIRGDVNGDGRVSLSDSAAIMGFLFLGAPEIECLNSADANDDNRLDIPDEVFLLVSLYAGGAPIPSPYPAPGPDPTPEEGGTDCWRYGGGGPLEDPEARLSVVDAVAPGGANRRAAIPIAMSNSIPLAGYVVRLNGGEILDPASFSVRDLSPAPWRRHDGFGSSVAFPLGYATLASLHEPAVIPAGQDVTMLEFIVCLEPGTPAGTYPITIEEGELAASCDDVYQDCSHRGRAILPALAGGTLTVDADVTDGECDLTVPPEPAEIHILFQLDDADSFPGGEASVPFSIKADRPTQGFSYSVKFDDAVLQCAGTRKLWQRPSGTPYELERFEWNNFTGYAVGAAVFSLTDSMAVLPVDEIVEVLEIDFDVSPDAEAGTSTPLEFRDGGSASGGAVANKLIASGQEVTPSLASSFVFVNGLVNIIPDGSPFVRGDSNGDLAINISDPQFTLNFLFLGDEAPRCEDAADANDDGFVNISDPITTLHFLFVGGTRLPPPGPGPGPDATSDDLHCLAGQ
jgi:hypothetical protein